MTAAGPVSHHAVHIGTLLGPAVVLALWAGWSDLQARLRASGSASIPGPVAVAAALSVGAAAIHALVAPAHFAEDPLYGAFFVASAVAQLSWATVVVVRPSRLTLELAAVGNAVVLALWALTRTIAIPVGVAAGQRESVGPFDLACGLLELGIVVCCLLTLRPSRRTVAA